MKIGFAELEVGTSCRSPLNVGRAATRPYQTLRLSVFVSLR